LNDLAPDDHGYLAEVHPLFRVERFHVTSGVGHFGADRKDVNASSPAPVEDNIRHTNFYVYTQLHYPQNITWTIGGSADFLKEAVVDRDQFNPKLGLIWNPFPATTLRAAVFRVLKRTLIASQTLEPTQVAGFNQFFDDAEGTESWRYGIAIDQKFSAAVYGGVEFSRRDMKVPFPAPPSFDIIERGDWEENLLRIYLYWTPHPWVAASGELQYERLERGSEFVGPEEYTQIKTYRLPFGISFFHPLGVRARLSGTYVNQEGRFGNPTFERPVMPGDDQFWIVDASIGYRLPKRWGLITLGVKNLLDADFRFQDTDPARPIIYPERLIFARVTLAF
jgi:outer membrane receptor protein involved in Fe transport